MAKRKYFTTPEGIAQYPYLIKPDTQYVATGQFKVNLKLDTSDDEVVELLEMLDTEADKAFDEAKEEAKTPAAAKKIQRAEPYETEEDEDGDATGMVILRFKMDAHVPAGKGYDAFDQKPELFDLDGDFDTSNSIYGGSKLKVNFWIKPYNMASTKSAGISLKLRAAQVTELVSGSGASSYGFDVNETSTTNNSSAPTEEEDDKPSPEDF